MGRAMGRGSGPRTSGLPLASKPDGAQPCPEPWLPRLPKANGSTSLPECPGGLSWGIQHTGV